MNFEQLHAMQYAENATKIYQLEKYQRLYPDLFGKHAVLETRRPREEGGDYYVPPALRSRCLVVDRLAWDPVGCSHVSCFPFKSYEEPCRPNVDRIQWARVDNELFVPACQPACERGLLLETRYRDGDCFVVNQAKKLYAMHPERYNGRVAKHARLNFDLETDRLRLGPVYCQAYGLQYDEQTKECYVPAAQYATELFVGTSIFRRYLLQPLKESTYRPTPHPPPLRSLLAAIDDRVWTKAAAAAAVPPVDLNKTAAHPGIALNEDLDEHGKLRPDSVTKIVSEVSADVGADLGLQAVTSYTKYRLTRKISERLARRILVEKGLKRALVHGLAKAAASKIATTSALTALRSGLSVATAVFAAYGIVSLLVDVFDPYEYNKILNREQVERIDRVLDLRYFETDDFRNVKLTPEDVWTVLQDEDDVEDEMSFYADRYEEYLEALKTIPDASFQKINLTTTTTTTTRKINVIGRLWILGLFLIGSMFFMKYIEYVAVLFCMMLVFHYNLT